MCKSEWLDAMCRGEGCAAANMSAHSEPQDGGSHLLDAEQQLDGDDHGRTNVASPSQPGMP